MEYFRQCWRFFYLNDLVIYMCLYLSCASNSRSYHLFHPFIWFSNFHGHYMHCISICIFQVLILWKLWKVETITVVICNRILDFIVYCNLYIQLLKKCIAFRYFVGLNYNLWKIQLNLNYVCFWVVSYIYQLQPHLIVEFDGNYVSFYLSWKQKQVHLGVMYSRTKMILKPNT
jgi:hypothetical protein